MSLCGWLLSLSITSSGFIPGLARVRISSCFSNFLTNITHTSCAPSALAPSTPEVITCDSSCLASSLLNNRPVKPFLSNDSYCLVKSNNAHYTKFTSYGKVQRGKRGRVSISYPDVGPGCHPGSLLVCSAGRRGAASEGLGRQSSRLSVGLHLISLSINTLL